MKTTEKLYPYVQVMPANAATVLERSAPPETADAPTSANYYQWGHADTDLLSRDVMQGSEEQLIEWLEEQAQKAIVLIIPGEKVVARQVDYNEKEKRHFIKMLPYEIEDDIIDDVESLHFSVGLKRQGQATIAYVDDEWFSDIWQFFTDHEYDIVRCIPDFQLIKPEQDRISLRFDHQRVQAHTESGIGFSCNRTLAPLLLQGFLQQTPEEVGLSVYMNYERNDEDGSRVSNLLNTIAPERRSEFYYREPTVSVMNSQAINFCHGPYGKTISQAQWIKEFRGVAILAVCTLFIFLGVNFFDIYQLQKKNQQARQNIESVYRSVIPRGVVNDPIRQMRRKLNQGNVTSNEPSQAVYLLSIVAPIIKTLNVDLSAVNYSNKDRLMRLNVQADSFKAVEKLRTDIVAKGLSAELLSSNAIDNKFQARLSISADSQ